MSTRSAPHRALDVRAIGGLLGVVVVAIVTSQPALAVAGRPCAPAPPVGSTELALTSAGVARTASLHLPAAAAGRRVPLLIALHGGGQDAGFFAPYSGFSRIADAEGFAVVYPNATGPRRFWNVSAARAAPDDVRFVAQLVDSVSRLACIDVRRIYATGVSNGGGMAALLGCALSDRIAAVAPVAGGYGSLPPCKSTYRVSVLEVHGTDDGVVPYAGSRAPGMEGRGSVAAFLAGWRARDACGGRLVSHRVAPQVMSLAWPDCGDGTTVAQLAVLGGAHQLPGGLPPDGGQRSTISAPWLIWRFLRDHTRPARPRPPLRARR